MNKVILSGRLTADTETRKVDKTSVTTFSIAVRRNFKNSTGSYDTDFIRCEAWGVVGENISKLFKKGSGIEIVGSWLTGKYEKNGVALYINNCRVESFSYPVSYESKNSETVNDNVPFIT